MLCGEGLTALIQKTKRKGEENSRVIIGKHKYPVSHLLFVDHSLLVTRAMDSQADNVLEIHSNFMKEWNKGKSKDIFRDEDVIEIVKIPIPNYDMEDLL